MVDYSIYSFKKNFCLANISSKHLNGIFLLNKTAQLFYFINILWMLWNLHCFEFMKFDCWVHCCFGDLFFACVYLQSFMLIFFFFWMIAHLFDVINSKEKIKGYKGQVTLCVCVSIVCLFLSINLIQLNLTSSCPIAKVNCYYLYIFTMSVKVYTIFWGKIMIKQVAKNHRHHNKIM